MKLTENWINSSMIYFAIFGVLIISLYAYMIGQLDIINSNGGVVDIDEPISNSMTGILSLGVIICTMTITYYIFSSGSSDMCNTDQNIQVFLGFTFLVSSILIFLSFWARSSPSINDESSTQRQKAASNNIKVSLALIIGVSIPSIILCSVYLGDFFPIILILVENTDQNPYIGFDYGGLMKDYFITYIFIYN